MCGAYGAPHIHLTKKERKRMFGTKPNTVKSPEVEPGTEIDLPTTVSQNTSLIPQSMHDVVSSYGDDDFKEGAKGTQYLARLQLMTSRSDACSVDGFPINHYAKIENREPTDLGESVDVLPLAWRTKALNSDTMQTVYNVKKIVKHGDADYPTGTDIGDVEIPNPAWFAIESASFVTNSKCMYGIEFLVWVPVLKEFLGFYFGSKSSRGEAPNLKVFLDAGSPATCGWKPMQNKSFKWSGPKVTACTTPMVDLPNWDAAAKLKHEFLNPPEETVEELADSEIDKSRD